MNQPFDNKVISLKIYLSDNFTELESVITGKYIYTKSNYHSKTQTGTVEMYVPDSDVPYIELFLESSRNHWNLPIFHIEEICIRPKYNPYRNQRF